MDLKPLMEDYLGHLRHERGCAQNTAYQYKSWLGHFSRWLSAEGKPITLDTFTAQTLRSYLYWMSRNGRRPRTILSAFNPIKGLGQFLVDHGLLDNNPAKSITYPKKDAAERPTVSTEEIAALISAADRLPCRDDVPLAKALLFTLVFAGVRFDELRSIKVAHYNPGNRTLLVAHGNERNRVCCIRRRRVS